MSIKTGTDKFVRHTIELASSILTYVRKLSSKMYNSPLPDAILRIILIDYVDIDFEDIIDKNTTIDDFCGIYYVICSGTERDYQNMMVVCSKVGNRNLAHYASWEFGHGLGDELAVSCAKIASKHGQLSIFDLMIREIGKHRVDTYLPLCTRISLRNGHFHIVDWIIKNHGDSYIKQEIVYVLQGILRLSISRKIRHLYAKYVD